MKAARLLYCLSVIAMLVTTAEAQEHLQKLQRGTAELKFAGPLAFGPDGVLFVGDPVSASVFALDTGDRQSSEFNPEFRIDQLEQKIAASLGVSAESIVINDLAVNPISGTPYLSLSRGSGPDAEAVILKLAADGSLTELSLKDIPHAVAALPNPPDQGDTDRRGRSQRMVSITDIALIDNQVVVAGLSNEEFSSSLRAIPYPFSADVAGTALEVYHGAHGKYETSAPVRTFTAITVDNEPYVVAAYTCTPLVRFPLDEVTRGEKIRGTTVAELGNWNSPLDMFVYEQDGKPFILMANSARGMMKISTENIQRDEGITEHVTDGGTAGQPYETIEELKSAVQLDKFGPDHAIVILKDESGRHDLKVVPLP